MNKQRIIWFQDGIKLQSPEKRWNRIDSLTEALIGMAGNQEFEHLISNPIPSVEQLFQRLKTEKYTAVVDLSGLLKEGLTRVFPTIPIISNLHLSRIRVVNSPRIDGSGFLISIDNKNRENLKKNEVVFWSRSRKELWLKGKTSDNKLIVEEIKKGCEDDILAIYVNPLRPVCHRNTWTCFDDVLMANLTREQRFGNESKCPYCGK